MASEMLKHDIQKLIDNSSDRLSLAYNPGKSDVWKQFILISIDGDSAPFVARPCSIGSHVTPLVS